MSRRYTTEQKESAMQCLDDNYGNVTITALQTGVPKRTLQEWKRQRKLQAIQRGEPLLREKNHAPQQQQTTDDADTPQAEYARIRQRLMSHIHTLTETLTDDPDTAHLRASALSRLIDRVIKLEALIKSTGPVECRITFEYPDGTIHDIPPWQHPDYMTDVDTEHDPADALTDF